MSGSLSQIMVYDLNRQERELAFGYIVGILLRSREACGKKSRNTFRDDVDVYVANLLLSLTDPALQERNGTYLYSTDAELIGHIENCKDNFAKYLIYKTNADHILISLSLFDHFGLRDSLGRVVGRKKYRAYQGRGKIYYELASTYHHKVYRRQTGICDALDKLSEYLEEYVQVMTKMRTEFFNFFSRINNVKLHSFLQGIGKYAHELEVESKTDHLLDAYNAWKKNPTPQTEALLKQAVYELEQMVPDFPFDLKQILGKSN